MTPTRRHYQYESLEDRSPDTIRLMTLLPGSDEDEIRCTISYTRQSEFPEYSAISYVWGTSDDSDVILVNDCILPTKPNLYSCLRNLRNQDLPLQLWVDAVCINQQDVKERSHQVRLMGEIYKNAKLVYVYLGEDTHDIRLCTHMKYNLWDILRELSYRHLSPRNIIPQLVSLLMVTLSDLLGMFVYPFLSPRPILRRIRNLLTRTTPIQLNKRVWCSVEDLLNREYWTRAWVVAELILAKQPVICVGKVQIPWLEFCELVQSCADNQGQYLKEGSSNHHIRTVQTFVFTKHARSQLLPLGTLMDRYSSQQCLDIRDKAYAFLPLASDCSDLAPDYDESELDLFFRLKEKIKDHPLLRELLSVSRDEIASHADAHGIQIYRLQGVLLIRCTDEDDDTWGKRISVAQWKYPRHSELSYWTSNTHLEWMYSDFRFSARAMYDHEALNNFGGPDIYPSLYLQAEDTVSVANPFDSLWLIRDSRGSIGWADADSFTLLKDGF